MRPRCGVCRRRSNPCPRYGGYGGVEDWTVDTVLCSFLSCFGVPYCADVRLPVMHIVFIAFGTRGDVQPIACLAEHLRRCHPQRGMRATLITHAAHHIWLAAQPYDLLPTSYVDSSPYGPEAAEEVSEQWGQATACWRALQSMEPQACLIVFNLFALEVGADSISACPAAVITATQGGPGAALPPSTPVHSTHPPIPHACMPRGITWLRRSACRLRRLRPTRCPIRALAASRGGSWQRTAHGCTACSPRQRQVAAAVRVWKCRQ